MHTHRHTLPGLLSSDHTVAVIKGSLLPSNHVVPVGGSFMRTPEHRTVAVTFQDTPEHSRTFQNIPLRWPSAVYSDLRGKRPKPTYKL